MRGVIAVDAAESKPGRLASAALTKIDQGIGVYFIRPDATFSTRDELRLPRDYSVTDVSTVEAAVALSQGHPVDLVLLDLGPSAERGLATLRKLKADPRLGRAPLVLLGAFEDMSAIQQGLQLGARDYLIRRETTPSLVARRVQSWLDAPARRRLTQRASRPAPAGHATVVPPAVPSPQIGMARLFGSPIVGLLLLLIKEALPERGSG